MRSQSTSKVNNKKDRIALDIKNATGGVIFSNFTNEEFKLFKKSNSSAGVQSNKIRFDTVSSGILTLRVVTYSEDLVKSTRLFKKFVSSISDTIHFFLKETAKIEEKTNQSFRRLVHNITTYNALTQQEIELHLPQSQMYSKNRSEQIEFAEKVIADNTNEFADSVLKITKYIQGIKAEISSFDKLYKKDPGLKIQKHEVHRVLMNTLYLFFPEFTDKQVYIKIQPTDLSAYFDYESINVALYHLINNAAKYCLPESQMEISISDFGRHVRITMFMISLRIDETETKRIFEEGYSGKHATSANLNGSGVGMYIVKELINLNHGSIDIQADRSGSKSLSGYLYDKNVFIIDLPAQRLLVS